MLLVPDGLLPLGDVSRPPVGNSQACRRMSMAFRCSLTIHIRSIPLRGGCHARRATNPWGGFQRLLSFPLKQRHLWPPTSILYVKCLQSSMGGLYQRCAERWFPCRLFRAPSRALFRPGVFTTTDTPLPIFFAPARKSVRVLMGWRRLMHASCPAVAPCMAG